MKRYKILYMALLLLFLTGCGEKSSLVLMVFGEGFTVTSAEGKTLGYAGGVFSGDMTVNGQQRADSDEAGAQYYLEVPGSESFTCRFERAGSQMFGLAPDYSLDGNDPSDEKPFREYTMSGDHLESATITVEGEMEAVSGENGIVTAAFHLDCAALGGQGFVRFSGAVGNRASIQPDGARNQFSFSGFLPGDCVLSYTGAQSNPWVTVTLSAGSGTIDLSQVAEGQITLWEAGYEAQTLTIS